MPPDGGAGRCSGLATGAGTCTSTNCTGCCDGDQCFPGNSNDKCGQGSFMCKQCAPGAVCGPISGECEPAAPCGPGNCSGCCTQGICATGSQDVACGTDGGACVDCTQSQKTCAGSTCQ